MCESEFEMAKVYALEETLKIVEDFLDMGDSIQPGCELHNRITRILDQYFRNT